MVNFRKQILKYAAPDKFKNKKKQYICENHSEEHSGEVWNNSKVI